MPEKVKNPYSRGRGPGAFGERVDEEVVARRYTGSGWSVPQCARAFGIGTRRVRSILRSHGVELRGNKKDLDPGAVVRAYAQFRNYSTVARLLGVSEERITQILDENSIQHDSSRWVAPQASRSRAAAARRNHEPQSAPQA
jgi:phage antirepressor YoqD-like protein